MATKLFTQNHLNHIKYIIHPHKKEITDRNAPKQQYLSLGNRIMSKFFPPVLNGKHVITSKIRKTENILNCEDLPGDVSTNKHTHIHKNVIIPSSDSSTHSLCCVYFTLL